MKKVLTTIFTILLSVGVVVGGEPFYTPIDGDDLFVRIDKQNQFNSYFRQESTIFSLRGIDSRPVVGSIFSLEVGGLRRVNIEVQNSSWNPTALYVGASLVASSALALLVDDDVKAFRDEHLGDFNNRFDDYLRYAPAVIMFGMKAFGVEGRTPWGELLVADAFSVAIIAVTTFGLKSSLDVIRPDGSSRASMSSGHTAMAFLTATMLHKEYGHISPWITVGSYAMATGTAVGRIMNNKHWLSDVLAGAAIGILSVELGYFIADKIFYKKHWVKPTDD